MILRAELPSDLLPIFELIAAFFATFALHLAPGGAPSREVRFQPAFMATA